MFYMSTIFLSICIPSYNRPEQLVQLLKSIDCGSAQVEVVICEDKAPRRLEVREAVKRFSETSEHKIHYHENDVNLGFDGNLRRLAECAAGDYIIFMGDDDLFVPGALTQFLEFLEKHRDKPYILRTYLTEHPDGRTEYYRYLPKSEVLPKGEQTVAWLFKRSVTICGFTVSRTEALKHATSDLDGTLLYQIYLMSQICLYNDSVYCDVPVAHAIQSFRDDKPMFGSSEAEKIRFTPGSISHDNSINFTKAYLEVTSFLDQKHGTHLTKLVLVDLSKYSYPFLSIQRKRGMRSFLNYAKRLEVEVGFGCTLYFHLYKWALAILGEQFCDRLIIVIKRIFGYTPRL